MLGGFSIPAIFPGVAWAWRVSVLDAIIQSRSVSTHYVCLGFGGSVEMGG